MTNKNNIVYSLLTISWLLSFIFSMISNYKLFAFLLKGSITIVLLILIYTDLKTGQITSTLRDHRRSIRKLTALLILSAAIPAATLLYSQNPEYGSLKLLSMISGTIPCVFVAHYIILTLNVKRLEIFLIVVISATISLVIMAIIIKPFSFTAPYSFSLTNWSHVLFARFISIAALVLLILHFHLRRKSHIYISGLVIFILATGVNISGHKASILGLLIAAALLIFYKSIYLSKHRKNLLVAFSVISLSVVTSVVLSGGEESIRRSSTIIQPKKLLAETGVQQRLAIWEIAFKVGNENLPVGTGLGGFNTENNLGNQYKYIKYPHNVPLEIYTELGIVVLVLFLLVLFKAGIKSYTFGIEFLLLLFYFVWLSLFSKDISTNTQLWFLFVILVISDTKLTDIKNILVEMAGRDKEIDVGDLNAE